MARPDPGDPALPLDGAPAGVDIGQAKHGNMPPLTDSDTGGVGTSVPYVEVGAGVLSGAALTAAVVVIVGARRRHNTPHPA